MTGEAYRVAIIGAGRIGAGFDSPDSEHVLTHARAVTMHPRLVLAALADIDAETGKAEAAKWRTRFFGDTDAMFEEVQPDIVVIASPDATHAALLARAALYGPKLIICEKPVVTAAEDMVAIGGITVPVVVNFSRRFDPTTGDIRDRLQAGEFGRVLSAAGIYTRGVVHNGSHIVDLARFLFGEVAAVAAVGPSVPDYPAGADSIGGTLSFERCERFFLMPADARAYAVFELDILAERARIRFTDEGRTLVVQDVIDDPVYDGYRILGPERSSATGLLHSLGHLYEHALDVIDRGADNRSSLGSATATASACLAIVEAYKKL